VLLSSGFTDEDAIRVFEKIGIKRVLEKPLSMNALAKNIQQVLG